MDIFKLVGTIAINNENATEKIKEITRLTAEAKEKISTGFGNIGKAALTMGKVVGGVLVGSGAIGGALVALTDNTMEYRTAMGKLEAAFTTSGHSAETAKGIYTELVSVLGDSDVAVEAANHLAKLTDNEKDLQTWTNICTGVFATFGDSLPIEGLTEAANETAKVGQVTGPLADALNWAGVSEDAFNESLAACTTEQERQQLIMETLNGIYDEASQKYQEVNADVIAANEAQEKYSAAMAEFGETAQPIVNAVKDGLGDLLTAASNLVENVDFSAVEEAIDSAFSWLIDAVVPAVEDFFNFVIDNKEPICAAIAAVATGFVAWNVVSIVQGVTAAIQAWQLATEGMTLAQKLLNLAMNANPIGIIITVIAALVAGFIYLWNTCDGFREFWIDIWDTIKAVFSEAVEAVIGFVTDLVSSVTEWFSDMKKQVAETVTKLKDDVSKTWDNFKKSVEKTTTKLKDNVVKTWNTLKTSVGKTASNLNSSVVSTWTTLKNKTESLFNTAKDKAKSAFETLKSKVTESATKTKESAVSTWTTLRDKTENLFNAAKDKATTAFETLKTNVIDKAKKAREDVESKWTTLRDNTENLFNAAKDKAEKAYETLKANLPEKAQKTLEKVEEKWGSLRDKTESLFNAAKDKAESAFETLKTNVTGKAESTATTTKGKWETLRDNTKSLLEAAKTNGANAFGGIKDKIENIAENTVTAAGDVFNKIKDKVSTAMDKAKEVLDKAVDKIKKVFNFEWSLPNIKLPHFHIEGGTWPYGLGGKGTFPSISIEWYKKAYDNAMILSEPTIFGYSAASGKMLAGGEGNGNEIVAGEAHLMNLIGSVVESKTAEQNERIVALLTALLNATVGGNKEMVQALLAGQTIKLNGREVARTVRTYA